jgi:putative membrane protein
MSPGLNDAFAAYFHFLSIIAAGVCIFGELLLYRRDMSADAAARLLKLDAAYLVAAMSLLASGFLRFFVYGKGMSFYLVNPAMHLKFTAFIALGLLSLPPTFHYLKWRPRLRQGLAPEVSDADHRRVRRYLVAEAIVFSLIPLLGTFIARGIG